MSLKVRHSFDEFDFALLGHCRALLDRLAFSRAEDGSRRSQAALPDSMVICFH